MSVLLHCFDEPLESLRGRPQSPALSLFLPGYVAVLMEQQWGSGAAVTGAVVFSSLGEHRRMQLVGVLEAEAPQAPRQQPGGCLH